MKLLLFVLITNLALYSCSDSEYSKLIKEELKKGRRDSLFLGLRFGMTKKEFFDHCMELNRQHVATNGLKGLSVLHKLQDSIGVINMNFYPEFYRDSIYEMRVFFNYQNWSPWIARTQPDSLQARIKVMFDRWYSPGYITTKRNDNALVFIKVNGNRRIVIFKDGESDVKVVFTDLLVENRIKK